MAALDFPSSPTVGQQYPSPAVAGQPIYTWDGEKWTTKGGAVGSTGGFNGTPAPTAAAGASGSSTEWARGDHVHQHDPAIDTALAAKAPLASPVFTGNPTGPTPALGDNDASLATTAFVKNGVLIASGSDFDAITDPGTYVTNTNNCLNTPAGTGGYWGLLVMRYSDPAYAAQLAFDVTSSIPKWYMRNKAAGTWGSWSPVVNQSQLATAAQYWSNAAATQVNYLTPWAVWASAAFQQLTDGATVTPNFSLGYNFWWSLGAAGRTLANPTNAKEGQSGMIYINAGASGTITGWGNAWFFAGGIKPAITPNGADALCYTVRAPSVIVCSFIKGLA